MTPSLLLLVRLLVPAEAAVAEPAPLRWVAEHPSCPQGAQVHDAVVELAGRWPHRDELQVEAFLQPYDAHWGLSLTLVVGDKVHRQELEAESCPALGRAAALIIAVSIDPVASASAAHVSVEPDAATPPPIIRDEPAPRVEPVLDPPPASRDMVPFVGASWALVTGMTPTLSSGPSVAAGVTLDRSRFEVTGRYVLPQTTVGGNGTARIQAGVVAARACLISRRGDVRGLMCAGLEAGALRARGVQVTNARTQHFPWLAGLVRGGVRWRVAPRWALAADVEGSVSAYDAQVVTGSLPNREAPQLFETPRIGVRGLVGVEFSISRP
ncbi:MAG: hypothetical protein KUG77_15000 [Nannocystaceae bacterium]|nr:hypothetical protein [Nannocystaceae bacterium]